MNILVLTNIYPGPNMEKENTPVVHYFTREWGALGHNVRVVHYPANFPRLYMWAANLVKKQLASIMGTPIRTTVTTELEYIIDNVKVKRIPLKKYKLHGEYSNNELDNAFRSTVDWLNEEGFVPDIITSHWVNPQIEMMKRLKEVFNSKTCYIAHIPPFEFEKIYTKEQAQQFIDNFDVMGFRSMQIQKEFREYCHLPQKQFMCFSGVPEYYLKNTPSNRTFKDIHSFIFVGTLYKRKHPTTIVSALATVYGKEPFRLTFVGQGNMEKDIHDCAIKYKVSQNIIFTGRQTRQQVMKYLQEADVFIMISQKETFGLVYLEAMAMGCLTIGSRNEGIDGIIKHGVNGFLCEAGNKAELTKLIEDIKNMPPSELHCISQAAIETAKKLTDKRTAFYYAKALESATNA